MIDQLLELSGFIEDFDKTFIQAMKKEFDKLDNQKGGLSEAESKRRNDLQARLDFCNSFVISIKSCQEIAAVNRLLVMEFQEGIEKNKMLDVSGSFRKSLLPPQVEFMNEFLKDIVV